MREPKMVISFDMRPLVEAVELLAEVVGYVAEPWQATMLRMAYAVRAGERPCGRPHGDLDGSCPGCGAAV